MSQERDAANGHREHAYTDGIPNIRRRYPSPINVAMAAGACSISDRVLERLKREAHRRGTTISELVEAALRRFLEAKPKRKPLPRLLTFESGGARVDVANREALYQVMEE